MERSETLTLGAHLFVNVYINQSTVNHEMRKANRAQCRKDRDEFEELAYSIQDEIISKVATAKED